MSDAETSAYLLMVGGLIWILVGIVGLVWLSRKRRENDIRTGRDRIEDEEVSPDRHH
jgi:LPXTG-motif cell wall-anchored protein